MCEGSGLMPTSATNLSPTLPLLMCSYCTFEMKSPVCTEMVVMDDQDNAAIGIKGISDDDWLN